LFVGDGVSDYDAAQDTGLHFLARWTVDLRTTWTNWAVPAVPVLDPLPTLVGVGHAVQSKEAP
jgi:hypothetical protein